MKKYNLYIAVLGLSLAVLSGCTKLLDTELEGTDLKEEDAIKSKDDVYRVLQSCYDVNANVFNGRIQNMGELLSDNLDLLNTGGDLGQVYAHNTSVFNGTVKSVYSDPYIAIFRANQLLNFIDKFSFSEEEKQRIRGEVAFIKAVNHFELVKLWAQPYGTTPGNTHNGVVIKDNVLVEVVPRNSVDECYTSVIDDLTQAINSIGLPESSLYYASRDAAKAYLAKVYFQMGAYRLAADMAGEVINSGRYALGTSVDRFQRDTVLVPEVIFKTRSYSDGATINDPRNGAFTANYRTDINPNPAFRATEEFYTTYAADTNDRRVKAFFEIFEPGTPNEFVAIKKFNKQLFDVPILHLTDMKLIRAEALALLNEDLATAEQDINDIRERAYGSAVNNLPAGANSVSILNAARYERRIEMFGEGDRIQQLKRRGAIEGEAIEIRGDAWDCDGMILQFPSTERTSLFELNPQGGC
jgi:hypothetical protein